MKDSTEDRRRLKLLRVPFRLLHFSFFESRYLEQHRSKILFLLVALLEIAFSAAIILIPLYLNTFISYVEISLIIGAYYLLSLSTASYFGAFSDRIGRKVLILSGTFIAALTYFPFGFTHEFYTLFLLHAVKGIASAMIAGPLMAYFADLAPTEQRGEWMGTYYLSRAAGGGIGFVSAGLFWDLFRNEAFVLFGIIILVAFLFMWRLMEEPSLLWMARQEFVHSHENPTFHGDDTTTSTVPTTNMISSSLLQNTKTTIIKFTDTINPIRLIEKVRDNTLTFKETLKAFKNKQFRLFIIAWFFFTCLIGSAAIYTPIILKKATAENVSGLTIGLLFLVVAIIVGAFQPIYGKLSDIYGRKPFLIIGVSATSILVILAQSIISLPAEQIVSLIQQPFSLSETHTLYLTQFLIIKDIPNLYIILTLLILAICAGSFVASSLAYLTDVIPEEDRGRDMGIVQALFAIGNIVGLTVSSIFLDLLGIVGIMSFYFTLSSGATLLVVWLLFETTTFSRFLPVFDDVSQL